MVWHIFEFSKVIITQYMLIWITIFNEREVLKYYYVIW